MEKKIVKRWDWTKEDIRTLKGPRAREGKDHGNWPVQGSKGTYRVHLRHGVSRVRSSMQHTIGIIFHDVKWGYARHSRGAT